MRLLPLESICRAQARLRGLVHRTPTMQSLFLSERLGVPVYLKLECLQKTGSFKPRGAFNKMLSLTEAERRRGIVAVSGGNHAQGAAYAARHLGIEATVIMPEGTPANYLDAARGYGAKVILIPDIARAFKEVARLEAQGLVLVHPFDDPLVAAGQGTVGLEILEDVPSVTHAYVSIGGGGLITGIASALKAIKPEVHVIGVETEGADVMSQSLKKNRLVEIPAITSIARTLGAPKACELTMNAVRELVEEVLVVDDAAALQALIVIQERTKYLVEPASSCCLVAAQRQRERFRPGDCVVLVLCGGNVALADICSWRERFADKANTLSRSL